LPLLFAVLLLGHAAAVSLRNGPVEAARPPASLLEAQRHKEDPEKTGEDFADSKTIEGPDCGNVKQIIGKWQRAGSIGAVAGEAQGVLSQAHSAVQATQDAADQAEEASSAVSADGSVPVGVGEAATYARDAAAKLNSKAADLQIEIDSFKTAMETDFAAGVDDEMVSKLKALTAEVATLTKAAHDAAQRVHSKGAEVKSNLKGDAAATLSALNKVLAPGEEAVASSAGIAQEAGFAVKAAEDLLARADVTLGKLEAAKDDAAEQAPVWQAAHDALHGRSDSFDAAKGEVATAIDEYMTAATELKTALGPLKEASKMGAGGDSASVLSASGDIAAAEEALLKYNEANSKLTAVLETLKLREEALEKLLEESEKKLAK